MEILVNIWLVITMIVMFFSAWFSLDNVKAARVRTPSKDDRRETRIATLIFLFAWVWPLVIPWVAYKLLVSMGKVVVDWYQLAFGREEAAVPIQSGEKLRLQQEMSRKANADRLARKERRRKNIYGYG